MMSNIKDLNIDKEILPIFNYALNTFTEQKITELLNTPLSSIAEIQIRQNIFKGFTKNEKVLKDYSYTILYFNDVYSFLKDFHSKNYPENRIQYYFSYSTAEKSQNQSKFSLLILFFHRLYTRYFSRLNLNYFPAEYKKNIKQILAVLGAFQLSKYESIIREKELTNKHLLEIVDIIKDLKKQGDIKIFWENLFLFEAFLSINKGFLEHQYTFPNFSDTFIIKINNFYHPALNQPVENDLITENNLIILNGPNMSGKSTLLKSIGICIYLGHLGFAVPAKSATFPFFHYFFIEINRQDDILNGYSHFMSEILNLKKVIKAAIKKEARVFAVFDELFSATNAEDAYEISQTALNGLSQFKNSFFLVSTHIQKLKNMSSKAISNYHLASELKDGKPVFTYKLRKGWSDLKVGKILFETEGLNELLNNPLQENK